MLDRERVLKAIEFCRNNANCYGCPYDRECGMRAYAIEDDTFALLQEQEPVVPRWTHPTVDKNVMMCGNCGIEIPLGKPNYCPWCGRRIKQDEI